MQTKKENKFNELQMVEIDQNKFAIQLREGNLSVNLTKMALPFSKKPADWLRTKPAKEYIKALSVSHICVTADLVKVMQGGSPDEQGTWANDYRIAMRFAQWLSPEFAIKVDEMLINLLINRQPQQPKQLPKEATPWKEETLITVKMGQYTNQIYIINGVIYARLAPICKYIGYEVTGGSVLINKLGTDNCRQILIGKWFINVAAFDRLLSVTNKTIQSAVMSSIYKDLFRVGRPMDDYIYHYTASQMLEIYELIMKVPVSKDRVIEQLTKGKI